MNFKLYAITRLLLYDTVRSPKTRLMLWQTGFELETPLLGSLPQKKHLPLIEFARKYQQVSITITVFVITFKILKDMHVRLRDEICVKQCSVILTYFIVFLTSLLVVGLSAQKAPSQFTRMQI